MAYRKVTILVDCDSDQEKEAVQRLADDISNMRVFNGKQLLSFYPILKKNMNDFAQLFKLITGPKGPMGLASVEGAKLLSRLTKLASK